MDCQMPTTSNVFQADEDMTSRRHSEAVDERRLHILASMAKLEGNSKPILPQTSPLKKANYPTPSTINQIHAQPLTYPFLIPQVIAPTVLPVPYFFYPSFAPSRLVNMHTQLSSGPMYAPMNTSPPVPKHLHVPNHSWQAANKELRLSKTQQRSTPLHNSGTQYSSHDSIMKTPDKFSRAQTFTPSPQSSPHSSIRTPPAQNPYNSTRNSQARHRQHCNAPIPEARQIHLDHGDRKENRFSQRSSRPSVERQIYPPCYYQNQKDTHENLTKWGNLVSRLESHKMGVGSMGKERLTINELKFLETLPPLPPRPEPQRSFSSSSSNLPFSSMKKKKDKFAWFDYCKHPSSLPLS
ncbi:hypothetical protein PCASD_05216 [Puccinia coronata f. sp. avenae]|uniref:Uncharacterized protein n=2 Tax=Puccinia coronata f. sp. avenae TaxID=200324 RepID=A0A2N5TH70_9BASI|nr:hypothetical protein PCASD_05216 [Puccinia coronata f. sp. avenae]